MDQLWPAMARKLVWHLAEVDIEMSEPLPVLLIGTLIGDVPCLDSIDSKVPLIYYW